MHLHRFAALLTLCLVLPGAGAFTPDQVQAGAASLYRARIGTLAQAGMLDRDAAFLARLARIMQGLAEQAVRDHPDAAPLSWELHASSDPDENASCMAGGKILVGQAYVEQLGLSDAELAMVLSHEMQHAILLHNLKEYEEAARRDPRWLARPFAELEEAVDHDAHLMGQLASLNRDQEIEADHEGLAMAWRAGWRAYELAAYFRKLEQAATMSHIGSASHPSALQRWRAARRQAERLASGQSGA